jgi:integrase
MKISKVSLYVREHSTRMHKPANKRFYEPGTIFVLRYRNSWETLGEISHADAERARLNRSIQLLGGWTPEPEAKPAPAALMLENAMDTYLSEIETGRKKKTHQAYSVGLRYFRECVGNKPVKDIGRGDMLKFASFLRDEKNQSPRSAYDKFESVMTFLKHNDMKPKIKAHEWPRFVEEEPEMYEQETLNKFLAACDGDERLLFEFFLQTGMREQEVIYATDRCVDFANCTVSVKHNPKHGWTPKMYHPCAEGSGRQAQGNAGEAGQEWTAVPHQERLAKARLP